MGPICEGFLEEGAHKNLALGTRFWPLTLTDYSTWAMAPKPVIYDNHLQVALMQGTSGLELIWPKDSGRGQAGPHPWPDGC